MWRLWRRGAEWLAVLAVLSACAGGGPARLQPSADPPAALWLNADGRPLDFEAYRKAAHAYIQQHHLDAASWRPADWADRIGPHEWRDVRDCKPENTHGVLLVHGLTDSPYLMRDLGDALAGTPLNNGRCLLLRSVLLPGHGTRPGDLLTVRYQDWLAATEWGLRSFAGSVDRVHLVGYSTGGALGLLAAYRQQDKTVEPPLASLVLLAPAIQAKDNKSRHPFFLRAVAWTGLLRWAEEHEDRDWAKYESFTVNAGAQVASLAQVVRQHMEHELKLPLFLAVSLNDGTIDTVQSVSRFLAQKHEGSRLWLVAPGGQDSPSQTVRAALADLQRTTVRDAAAAASDVRDFAHTALPVNPVNQHYGRGGRYVNCLAYSEEPEAWQACLQGGGDVVYGEPDDGLDPKARPLVRRLTFNPLFQDMVRDIRAFLERATRGDAR